MKVVIIHTESGRQYAKAIASSVNWLRQHARQDARAELRSVNNLEGIEQNPSGTIFHLRAAHPTANWMDRVQVVQNAGFRVVNSVNSARVTSDKCACAFSMLAAHVPHPRTWQWDKRESTLDPILAEASGANCYNLIAKPITSMEQGANVIQFHLNDMDLTALSRVPGSSIIIQERVWYDSLHRVIVINGNPLPYTFVDMLSDHDEGNWKVSCCLNRTTMTIDEEPDEELLEIAVRAQQVVGASISFVDIFKTVTEEYMVSEVNTACNLSIHENLARQAGRNDWNIHYKIANYLVRGRS